MRLHPLHAVLAALTLAGAGATPAAAAPQTLAPVTANVPLSAHGGWVAWSTRVPGGWALATWHGGALAVAPIAARAQPFDVDLGSDARGRAVATFSRCVRAPDLSFTGRVQPWTGAGCRVRVLDLASGRERAAGIHRPKGTSDTSPSMWRGRIAFARRDPRHRDVSQVLLWSPKTRRTTSMRHGGVPTSCPFRGGCEDALVRGAVQGLDLGARLVTFLWWVQAPAVIGHGGWEVRANRLRDGRSVLVGAGYLGEACTDGEDASVPSVPSAAGSNVWYARTSSACYVDRVSLSRFDTGARRLAAGPTPGVVLQYARAGGAHYALVAPRPAGQTSPTCETPAAPCALQRLDAPALSRVSRLPRSPFD